MRGSYTAGVLDLLMDEGIKPDYVIGVSAGACNAVSFVSGQRGRSLRVNSEYIKDKRYLSLSNFIKTKSMFGMDFLFNEITNKLEPLDYDAILASDYEFKIGVTDVETGKCVYFDKTVLKYEATVLRASSSIPIFSPEVEYEGRIYLDGGTSDPIPVKKALNDGCDRLLVILTRELGFEKKREKLKAIYQKAFKDTPKMIETMNKRHLVYNESTAYARQLEKDGRAYVLAPKRPLKVGRFEKDKSKLMAIYNLGYNDAKEQLEAIKTVLFG